jgi:hypothetical protein
VQTHDKQREERSSLLVAAAAATSREERRAAAAAAASGELAWLVKLVQPGHYPPSRRIASTPNPATTSPSCDMLLKDSFGAPSLVYFPVKPPGHITCNRGGSGRPLRSATHTYRLGIKMLVWEDRVKRMRVGWIGCGRICQVLLLAAASQPF